MGLWALEEQKQGQAMVATQWGLVRARGLSSNLVEEAPGLATVRIALVGHLAIGALVVVDEGFALPCRCKGFGMVESKFAVEDRIVVDIYWDMVPEEIEMLFQRTVSLILQMVLSTISTIVNIPVRCGSVYGQSSK